MTKDNKSKILDEFPVKVNEIENSFNINSLKMVENVKYEFVYDNTKMAVMKQNGNILLLST